MDRQELVLPDQLGREQTDTLQMEMLRLLTADQNVVINAQQVSECECSGLQLLTAFVNDAKAGQLEVEWLNPSRELHTHALRLGLNECLGIPNDKLVDSSEITAVESDDELIILQPANKPVEADDELVILQPKKEEDKSVDDELVILSPAKKEDKPDGDDLCPVF
jgi:anti-anti-sigma regulatory factor